MKTDPRNWLPGFLLAAGCLLALLPGPALAVQGNNDDAAVAAVTALVDRWQPPLERAFAALSATRDAAQAKSGLEALHAQGVKVRGEVLALLRQYPQLKKGYAMTALAPVFFRIGGPAARFRGILAVVEKRFNKNTEVLQGVQRIRALAGG
jgi:hypothetical protein